MARSLRLEWISIVYLVFFVLAILSPSLVRGEFLGFSEDRIEEMLIFLFGLTGLITFSLYERVMERRERERDAAITDRDRARKELVSSYEYIGGVNRQISALKQLANETAINLVEADRLRRDMFKSLVASAASLIRATHGEIRFINLSKLRTIKEYHVEPDQPLHVPNKDLLSIHSKERAHSFIRGEDGKEILVIPSDRQDMECKAFLLLPTRPDDMLDIDPSLLKVYANQAEVLYRVLGSKGAKIDGEEVEEVSVLETPA